ncbi:lasso peptide biosynthesis B2 protein [Granulicella cerasi]|uniref:Lasso peptide biosynthesis B2 protein n=1 Tax=Granulicella cerasi TaxID=741063 RepID=A0ABW1ZEI9_9BACT|nr:lasso peptide biosynthesis B2 protein [Granulicella cerasi]
MKRYALEGWLLLAYIEWVMKFGAFKEIKQFVCEQEVASREKRDEVDVQNLCHAMDLACVFYFKPVLCLQRSAATTVLLKRHGWNATMVIGAQIVPFLSHAWCEVAGSVVNDKPYMREKYAVLEEF